MSLSLLKLQALGPKEDFDVLSKWIDCASWYSPPVNRLPPTDSVTCDNHHASSVVPNPGSLAQKSNIFFPPNFLKWLKKYGGFLLYHIWAEALWYVRLYVSKQRWAGFCYLTALQHPVDEPLCRMPLQGMVFVRAWAKATTCNPLLSLLFSSSESELCIQYELAPSLTWSKQNLRLIQEHGEGSTNVLICLPADFYK